MESLNYGTEARRFRKRDAFVLAIPKNYMVILRTKAKKGINYRLGRPGVTPGGFFTIL